MGVCYYVRSENNLCTDHGNLAVSTGVDTKRVPEVLAAILNEFCRLKNHLVPADELTKAKDYFVGRMYLGLESSDALAEFSAEQEILKKEILTAEEIEKRIQRVTAEDIQAVAKDIFRNKNLNLAIISRFKDKDALQSVLTI